MAFEDPVRRPGRLPPGNVDLPGCALAHLLTVTFSVADRQTAPLAQTMHAVLLTTVQDYVRRHLGDHRLMPRRWPPRCRTAGSDGADSAEIPLTRSDLPAVTCTVFGRQVAWTARSPGHSRLATPFRADLAFLSACQTAISGTRLLDESIHHAAALQTVGFRHIIATLWSIYDRTSPAVATAFYSAVQAGGRLDSRNAALALHHALLKLRENSFITAWAAYVHIGP